MNAEPKKCPKCGATLPINAAEGLCPSCLMQQAMNVTLQSDEAMPSIIGLPVIKYFGNYELQHEIARGGMGVVYKARQVNLNRIVAVKTILTGNLADDDSIKRFHTEAEAAANLQHPNIVAIHEVGEQDGLHYFSMDFVEGKNLAQIAGGKPLAGNQAATYVKKMAEAIHFAHQRGTLHRDLKPSNVLIDQHDEPRITDFGLAKIADRDSSITRSGSVLGTPNYMSPEQATARADQIGPQSDVYSLGAILYELLTGRPPFKADSVQATLMKVASEEPQAPRKINANAPVDLETICMKCLEKSPQRRYASARDLAEDLGRFLKHEPILARPVPASRKIEQWAKRNPMFIAAVAALAFLVVSSVAYDLWQQNQHLQWLSKHLDAEGAGPRTAFVKTLNDASGWIFILVAFAFGFFSKKIRGVPVSKMFDTHWLANRPKEPVSPRAMTVYEIIATGSILFALFYLAKIIDATVWENYAQHSAYWTIYALMYFGVMILWFVRRERHAQLFGRDSGAMDASRVPADLSEEILRLFDDGMPVVAIKRYRDATGCTLADARTAVNNIAKQNGMDGIPAAKISAPKLALNLAITAAAVAITLYFFSPESRWPVLLQFFGGWIFMAASMTAMHFKGFVKNGLPRIVAMFLMIATIGWQAHKFPGHFQFASIMVGLVAGAAVINMSHKSPPKK